MAKHEIGHGKRGAATILPGLILTLAIIGIGCKSTPISGPGSETSAAVGPNNRKKNDFHAVMDTFSRSSRLTPVQRDETPKLVKASQPATPPRTASPKVQSNSLTRDQPAPSPAPATAISVAPLAPVQVASNQKQPEQPATNIITASVKDDEDQDDSPATAAPFRSQENAVLKTQTLAFDFSRLGRRLATLALILVVSGIFVALKKLRGGRNAGLIPVCASLLGTVQEGLQHGSHGLRMQARNGSPARAALAQLWRMFTRRLIAVAGLSSLAGLAIAWKKSQAAEVPAVKDADFQPEFSSQHPRFIRKDLAERPVETDDSTGVAENSEEEYCFEDSDE